MPVPAVHLQKGSSSMHLKKGLSFIAFGFLFVLVNLNLTISHSLPAINLMPDFVGWILFFLAFGALGSYMEGRGILKWIPFVLIFVTGVLWLVQIFMPEQNFGMFKVPVNILTAVYMFLLFGVLERIARDFGSVHESTLRVLKYLSLGLYIALNLLSLLLLAGYVSAETAALPVLVMGAAILVAALITLVILLALRKEIGGQEDL